MNDTWIALNRDQVRLVVTTVGASRGIGVNQLHVTLELTTRSAALADAQIWLGGSVRLSNLGAGGGYLTTLRADIQPTTIVAPGGHQTVSMVADFDDRQLQIIEGWRTSGLTFQFGFSGNVVGPEGAIPFWSANVDYTIDQSAWIVLVEQLGYRKLMLLSLRHRNRPGSNRFTSRRLCASLKKRRRTSWHTSGGQPSSRSGPDPVRWTRGYAA